MPRTAIETTSRLSLRIDPEDKALLMRAVAYAHTDLTDFVVKTALKAARQLIAESETIRLSERDSLRVLEALENPPPPNDRLVAAARRPRNSQ